MSLGVGGEAFQRPKMLSIFDLKDSGTEVPIAKNFPFSFSARLRFFQRKKLDIGNPLPFLVVVCLRLRTDVSLLLKQRHFHQPYTFYTYSCYVYSVFILFPSYTLFLVHC